jgi:multidrug efflux pump subunit AcrA (membrane-fusion protein)
MDETISKFGRAGGLTLTWMVGLGSIQLFAQPAPITVEVAPVVIRSVQEEVSFVATLEPDIMTTVGAVVAGRVLRADVREGDQVVGGKTILIQLDPTPRKIALREAQAAAEKARQQWEQLKRGYRSEEIAQRQAEVAEQKAILGRAERDSQRAERLYRDELISQAENERLKSEFVAAQEKYERLLAAFQLAQKGPREEEILQAEAEFQEAKAHYDLIAYELDRTALRAPFTGFLVKKRVEVGTWVNPGDSVADLVDLDPVYATGPVGELKIGILKTGLTAAVTVDALPGRSLSGTVSHIVPRADPQSHTFPVKVAIPNPDGRLKAGMLARVTVKAAGERQSFLVPKDALVRRRAGNVIFVVADGTAREYKIKTGRAFEGLIEIHHDGLRAGQEVVTLGNESLRDGTKIQKVNHRTDR